MKLQSRPKDRKDKIEKVTKAWEELRSGKSFAGMTLAQYKAKVQPSLDARDEIESLAKQMIAAITRRENADVVSMKQTHLVVNAVKGDPAEGDDGALYAAFGYVRKSARKSGLRNKPPKPVSGAAMP